jgi:hypothetical protein
VSLTDCEILISQLRASWIEWLYADESEKAKKASEIVSLEYRIATKCTDYSDGVMRVFEELKKLPII